ncbi:MAG TPA: hypothetical protein VHZ97_13665 [Pseudonocardiaceae bacterium]|nr:hypothetical protein [Pseudonocardiaceae bacterium]
MKPATELAERLLDVLRAEPGLRPATPANLPAVPWDLDTFAIDIDAELVEVRVVATELPLRLDHAQRELRAAIDESPFTAALLRMVISDIDAAAVTFSAPPGPSAV